jgi:hypothetical protein
MDSTQFAFSGGLPQSARSLTIEAVGSSAPESAAADSGTMIIAGTKRDKIGRIAALLLVYLADGFPDSPILR